MKHEKECDNPEMNEDDQSNSASPRVELETGEDTVDEDDNENEEPNEPTDDDDDERNGNDNRNDDENGNTEKELMDGVGYIGGGMKNVELEERKTGNEGSTDDNDKELNREEGDNDVDKDTGILHVLHDSNVHEEYNVGITNNVNELHARGPQYIGPLNPALII